MAEIVYTNSVFGRLHINPEFLRSNATSHKWAFGELLDNSINEVQNGATFVVVDKISNLRDGTTALLIQDDGSGMNPDAMRRCLSFGFSDKHSKTRIGQYGNGFKTSSMRLGADVVVFSRSMWDRKLTQSVGLLSYTFSKQTGQDRIVVPMWSPFTTEAELLKQFDDIGSHGTKIIVYNLWHNNDGKLELDFDSDPEESVITTIGFLKEAPAVNVHGFNVYHKNRLILVDRLLKLIKQVFDSR